MFDIEARFTADHSASRSSHPASEASAKPSLARHRSIVVGMFVGSCFAKAARGWGRRADR